MQDITVVVPVYNGAEMLEPCVKSILNASEQIAEIIVVDDGSTDNTLETAERLTKEFPEIRVIHTTNHGCYTARVTGIKAATTPYIASADVDDRYIPGALDRLASLLKENDADVAIGAYREVSSLEEETVQSPGEPMNTVNQPEISTADTQEIHVFTSEQMWPRIMKWKTQEFVNYVWNKLYKREVFSELADADGVNQGEDVLITCQAFCNVNKIVETTETVYLYYQNPNSLTRVGFGKSDLDLICVWDKIVAHMNTNRSDLVSMAEFNRWRTDFTLITRLILANNREIDKQYAGDLVKWRKGLKAHWKSLISLHVMPRNREVLVLGLRFFYWPTKVALRLAGGRFAKK